MTEDGSFSGGSVSDVKATDSNELSDESGSDDPEEKSDS